MTLSETRRCRRCGQESPDWIMTVVGDGKVGICPKCYRLCQPKECPVVPPSGKDLFGQLFPGIRQKPKE